MDAVDREILALLEEDGRITATELAKRIQLGLSATSERLRQLQASGVIRKFTAVIDPTAVGRTIEPRTWPRSTPSWSASRKNSRPKRPTPAWSFEPSTASRDRCCLGSEVAAGDQCCFEKASDLVFDLVDGVVLHRRGADRRVVNQPVAPEESTKGTRQSLHCQSMVQPIAIVYYSGPSICSFFLFL